MCNNFEVCRFFSGIMNSPEGSGYGIAGGCFTNVVLHSSVNYQQQHATEWRRPTQGCWRRLGRCTFTCPWSFQSVQGINHAVLQIGRWLVRSQLVSLKFFIDIKSFRLHYGPGIDSASNRNEYEEHFLGVKVAGVLVGKPEGNRPLGRPRRRWEDNIRMDLQEVGLGYEDWIGLAQDRDRWRALVSAVRNLRVP